MFNYHDIGKKIKGLAKITFIVESIASVIIGICTLIEMDFDSLAPIAIIICGPFVAWVGSWLLYGFGEIIDKLSEIEKNTRG